MVCEALLTDRVAFGKMFRQYFSWIRRGNSTHTIPPPHTHHPSDTQQIMSYCHIYSYISGVVAPQKSLTFALLMRESNLSSISVSNESSAIHEVPLGYCFGLLSQLLNVLSIVYAFVWHFLSFFIQFISHDFQFEFCLIALSLPVMK